LLHHGLLPRIANAEALQHTLATLTDGTVVAKREWMKNQTPFALYVVSSVITVLGCGGDSAPMNPMMGCAFQVRVVAGPGEARPLSGADVYVNGSGAATTMRTTTDAMGATCINVSSLTMPYQVTVHKAGHTATTIMNLARSPQGAVRIDPLVNDTRTPSMIRVTLQNVPTGSINYLIDGFDVDTTSTTETTAMVRVYPHEGLPLTLRVLARERSGSLVNFASAELGPRDRLPPEVTVSFGAAPQVIRNTVSVTIPLAGVRWNEPTGVRIWRFYRGLYGTAVETVGLSETSPSRSGASVALQTLGGALQPQGVAMIFDVDGLRGQAWTRTYDSNVSIEAPKVTSVDLQQISGRWTLNYNVNEMEYAVFQYGHSDQTQAAWKVYASLPGEMGTITAPTLPEGITMDTLGLTDANARITGILLRMHEGAPWSTVPEVSIEPEYDVAVSTREMRLR
jgi:hypothetical protein